MPIRAVAIDSGGHHTQATYRFCRERSHRRVWPIKGRGGPGIPVWPMRPPKLRDRGNTPFILGHDAAKEAITSRLRTTEPGPGFCHFPVGRDLEYFRGLAMSERRVRTYRRGLLASEWKRDSAIRNEPLDCRCYAFAALAGLQVLGLRIAGEATAVADLPLFANRPTPAEEGAAKPATIQSRWMAG